MLVSAWADRRLRTDVADGVRPRPEYLVLESSYGVELLDWSRVPGARRSRTALQSTVHALAAVRRAGDCDVVLSDGEHVGIPLAMAMRGIGASTPHLVIGHRLSTSPKTRMLRDFGAQRAISRIVVHSALQHAYALRTLGLEERRVSLVPYYADAEFWHPQSQDDEPLVVAAGREHRDYKTLAAVTGGEDFNVYVASGSVHSPAAGASVPDAWPRNFRVGFADYLTLRGLYARARVVVVPVVATDFQAGVTTVLEAMAMGKAVVTTNAEAQGNVIRDGVTGIAVPAGNATELRAAIMHLMGNPAERARLGRAAREAVLADYGVDAYSARLAGHIEELRRRTLAA